MKLIFSRKGFDSNLPGYPSPIIDGQPRSLPIPGSAEAGVHYGDLWGGLGKIVEQLTTNYSAESFCHLDPDIDSTALPRPPEWRGAFGQVSGAQGHLRNQKVCRGDLFLFFGLFQPVCRDKTWRYTGRPEHRIFGYLQIDDVVAVGNDPSKALLEYPWLARHPHFQPGWDQSNTVYIAAQSLKIGNTKSSAPGWGVFKKGLKLTAAGSGAVSRWQTWPWLNPHSNGVGMSWNPYPGKRWDPAGFVTVASRGQEFVANIGEDQVAMKWLEELFEELL